MARARKQSKPRVQKPKVHREWFRSVSFGGRKSCPECHAKLLPGEWIWTWGEYRNAKFRAIQHFCKSCWPTIRLLLVEHADECGCNFEFCIKGGSIQPDWLTLAVPDTCCHLAAVEHAAMDNLESSLLIPTYQPGLQEGMFVHAKSVVDYPI